MFVEAKSKKKENVDCPKHKLYYRDISPFNFTFDEKHVKNSKLIHLY